MSPSEGLLFHKCNMPGRTSKFPVYVDVVKLGGFCAYIKKGHGGGVITRCNV